jgi:hypothetical protein
VGAELYLHSPLDRAQRRYRPKFEEFAKKRDTTTNGRKEYYQAKVVEYFDRMQGEAYYGDSYNDTNLLWKLGLDYSTWFACHVDEGRLLHPAKAELILKEVLDRRQLLEQIEDSEEREYFERRFAEFTAFLQRAISMGEPILCAL